MPVSEWLCNPAIAVKYLVDAAEAARCNKSNERWRLTASVQTVIDNTPEHLAGTYWAAAKYLTPGKVLWPKLYDTIEVTMPAPKLCDVLECWLSPNLCRYFLRAVELDRLFGPLANANIVEFGGGWGGLCAVLCGLFQPQSYSIHDLPAVMDAQQLALRRMGIRGVAPLHDWQDAKGDIIISDYAFSELTPDAQERYAQVFARFSHGAFMCPAHLGDHRLAAPQAMQALLARSSDKAVTWGADSPHYRELAFQFGDPRMAHAFFW